MNTQSFKIKPFFERLPVFLTAHRFKVWIVFICLTALAVAGLPRFKIDMSWTSLLSKDEPVKIAYDRFRAVFGSDEVLYLVYEAKDKNVFSHASLTALKELQEELERGRMAEPGNEKEANLSHITDITSLINASFLEGKKDGLISRDFVGHHIPTNMVQSDRLRKEALTHPDYPLILCSKDARYGGIVIRTDFNARIETDETKDTSTVHKNEEYDFHQIDDSNLKSPLDQKIPKFQTTWAQDYLPFMNSIYKIINNEKYTRQLKFYPAGNPEFMGFLARELEKEIVLIIILSLALILFALGLLFRSVSAVVWPLVIVVCTLIWTLGAVGWIGIVMSDFINIIVFLLIAVGVADAIHILSGYLFFLRKGEDPDTAICSVYKKTGFACFLTSLTTATGLLALSFAPIVAIQRLAVLGAIGIMVAFLITVFMLPVMLTLLKPKVKKKQMNLKWSEYKIQRFLTLIRKLGTTNPRHTIIVFIAVGIVLVPGILRIEVNSNILTIIRESKPIRKNFDMVNKYMAGTGNIEILVDTGMVDGMKNPLILQSMEMFQQILEKNFTTIVYKTQSLVNVTKNSYKVLNEGRKEMYIIPEDPDILSQTLFLFSTANPKDRRLLVTDDFRAARIIVNTRNLSSKEGLAFMKKINRIAGANFKMAQHKFPNLKIEATGQLPLFLRMMDLISWSQLQSFGISLFVIAVILLLVIRDFKTGLMAIVPNLLPIMSVFGLMGWLNIPLDVHTLLVVPIIIGISVDDTIHFITHFSLELTHGRNAYQALCLSIQESGQAIIFTSLVLAFGYLAFLICVNKGFAYFGFLSSAAVLTALLNDLILLPALLSVVSKSTKNPVALK